MAPRLEELLFDILGVLTTGVMICDPDGRIVYANPAHDRILERRPGDVLGLHVTEVVPTTVVPAVMASRRPMTGVTHRWRNKFVISDVYPVIRDGQLVAGMSVFRDVTEVIELNRRVETLRSQVEHVARELEAIRGRDADLVIGRSPGMQEVYRRAMRAAQVDSTVLLQGESGTGKEHLARFIHGKSARRDGPFVAVNCAAIPESLLESELFGYADGAFTGARRGGQPGQCHVAAGGTLFLDEIGDMPLGMQVKLLRVLQTHEVKRLGDTLAVPVDFRVMAATNRDLSELVQAGRFREDLYYRLNVIPIRIPPLRQRREDLPLLIEHTLARLARRLGLPSLALERRAMRVLLAYGFPGNVRELENILEQGAVLSEKGIIRVRDLPALAPALPAGPPKPLAPADGATPTLGALERSALAAALAGHRTKVEAARALGISRVTLYRKIQRYGL